MRIHVSILAALGGVSLMATSSTALAGGCGYNSPCDTGVVVTHSAPQFDPMTVQIEQPYGFLKSVEFQRSPNVSITRIHGMGPTAGIADAPSGFTGGCHPSSTQYCHSNVGTPVRANLHAVPAHPAPAHPIAAYAAPVHVAPAHTAPVVRHSAPAVDMTKFQSRQYGATDMSRGTALVPTSTVDRNPAHAQAALNSGRTVPQAIASGGMAPGYGTQMTHQTMSTQPYISPPVSTSVQVASSATAPMAAGVQANLVAADGSYWEQVSGPTLFGDTMATKVVCKRQLPRKVVNPVVGVPVPVPAPVTCAQPPAHGPVAHHPVHAAPAPAPAPAHALAGGPAMDDWSF